MTAPRITTSEQWITAKPKLSVLIPYFKDDPVALMLALDALPHIAGQVEVIVYNDGTDDIALEDTVNAALSTLTLPAMNITATVNKGRSAARNALQDAARADWVLFLDADMRPVKDSFLQDYLTLIQSEADVVFGGFHVEHRAVNADRDLHRALSQTSDCLSLAERQAAGPQFVATSNLCVRKTALEAEGFDPEFSGWGWEDSEWAARIAKRFTLRHVDNPALHLGLETTDTLLSRFRTSGPNYVRFTQKHPELAQSLALYRIATKLGHIPGQRLLRPLLKVLVKNSILPVSWRVAALKLWRASWYGEALTRPAPVREVIA
ncbi:glycosyltransferase family 2 protein [Litorimonas sp. RW-G-Af-16]|uniref:glycosyltransferase family 2 protein n=1 Tax=Litorimonas sp. RW-G-Af-16 TaxID=3241168 RepID=UPI00390C9DC9